MSLTADQFLGIIAAAPLVSIDLVIRNAEGQVLLGWRVNRPAQNCWFVPGGRIRKDELIRDALRRISQAELGITIDQAQLLGAFDHLYPDNYYDRPGISTHYVVLGYECRLPEGLRLQPDTQHAEMRWWEVEQLLRSPEVHPHTKRYFQTK